MEGEKEEAWMGLGRIREQKDVRSKWMDLRKEDGSKEEGKYRWMVERWKDCLMELLI